MNYWIIAAPRKRMEYCIRVATFGLNRKFILGRLEIDDRIACYSERKIIALGHVTGAYYVDDSPVFNDKSIFPGDSIYPDRFNFEATLLGKNEFDFFDVIDQMSFIKNPAHWSVHFSSGITQINKSDWKAIEAQTSTKSSI